MAKTHIQFVCQNCGAGYARWQGRCDQCGGWNTVAEVAGAPSRGGSKASPAVAVPLRGVQQNRAGRLTTGIGEFDRTLGGGIVAGSLVLIGGDPGIGKSTLVLDAATRAAKRLSVLYVSAEESAEQVKLRADRLGTIPEKLDILAETDIDTAIATATAGSYGLVIIDSIQAMRTGDIPAAAGSVSQVATGASKLQQAAKSDGPAVLIVGHVTKEGGLAGPKTLEHLVDTVLYLEGERGGELRILRSVKNRFGSTGEVGIFRMSETGLEEVSDPSGSLVDAALAELPGTVSTVTLEGARPLAVEIQALTALSALGYPRRMAAGIDSDRLQLTVAVLSRKARLQLGNQDIFVNVVGGIRVGEPSVGLPLALAIASSLRGQALGPGSMAIGEIGLSGEIRSVGALDRRVAEGRRLGYRRFIVPKAGALKATQGVTRVATLSEALRASGIIGDAAT